MGDPFRHAARAVVRATGSAWAFALALAIVAAWAVSGPFFHFAQGWQLVINTGTTIVTFLMVFLIQNAQNLDTAEIKALLRQIAEDLPDVDDRRAKERVAEEVER